MKQVINYAIYGSVIAIAVGILGAFGLGILTPTAEKTSFAAAPILGHITLTQTDANGNIIAYRQTDNLITNRGENCAAAFLFGVSGGTGNSTCNVADITKGTFTVVALGNASNGNVKPSHRILSQEITGTGQLLRSTVTTPVLTAATDTTGASVKLTKQFNNTVYGPVTVTESGIFNGTTPNLGAMFAKQKFTGITLNNGESLTVEWTVTIGGTTSIANEANQ